MRTLHFSFRQISDLNEIIFAHRNKAYGAYELRTHYNERLFKALLITLTAVLLLLFVVTSAINHTQPPALPVIVEPPIIIPLTKILIDHPIIPPPPHPPLQQNSSELSTKISSDTASETKKRDTTVAGVSGVNTAAHGDSALQGNFSEGKKPAPDSAISNHNGDLTRAPAVYPSFPGGSQAFSRYIQKHFTCNGESISRGEREGKIILRFVILKDGSVVNVEVLKSNVALECTEQAKSLLIKSPKWNPGLQNNNPVNVQMVLPITIQQE